jgi:hypothetical protein
MDRSLESREEARRVTFEKHESGREPGECIGKSWNSLQARGDTCRLIADEVDGLVDAHHALHVGLVALERREE